MPNKVLYCNSFEVNHNQEVVLITLRFEGPDGCRETVYACISPAGAVAFKETLENTLAEYEEKHGKIVRTEWRARPNTVKNDTSYLT